MNINRRDWVVLLLALLLAFSIWLIHNLSLNYNDFFSVSIVAECNIQGHSVESANKCDVTARCRATGYKLIRSHIFKSIAHKVSFKPSDLIHYEEDIFFITTKNLQEYSHQIYGPGVSVEYFVSDTLFFRFPYENYKKVPVEPVSVITYREQYMPDGDITLDQDSIIIYGEPYKLEGVDKVYTRTISHSGVNDNLKGEIGLEEIKDVRFSVDQVRYSLDVKRFVEMELKLPVQPINVPQDKVLRVYPSDAIVKVRCTFPLIDDPERGLELHADYNDYMNFHVGKCPLKLSGIPRGVIRYEIAPSSVSVLVE